ncbi:Ppx/GppA phosphatase family protein [Allorhizobium taibaishanense]|uniref:Exopolyphosphatase n=1 Tax=Allorhizobium taibaishanense TaxID=887144 RepID=A0A1Q9AA66_9HYPH|nr:exopolyphosphatase [Allorhizobium taibaishanense]
MVDPGNGGFPPANGASTSNRAEAKSSRRGRGKRKGRKAGPGPGAVAADPTTLDPVAKDRTAEAAPDRRSISSNQHPAPQTAGRKRKRRRKGHGSKPGPEGSDLRPDGGLRSASSQSGLTTDESRRDTAASAGSRGVHDGLSALSAEAEGSEQRSNRNISGQGHDADNPQGLFPGAKKPGRKRRKNRGKQSAQVRPLQPGRSVDARPPSASYCPPAGDGQNASAVSPSQGRGRHGQGGHGQGGHGQNGVQSGHHPNNHAGHHTGHHGHGAHGSGRGHHPARHHGPAQAHPAGQGAWEDHPADFYAALDLGTNNCRLLIAQPTRPGQFRVVDAFSRIVRLGEGLAATGRLSQDAMDRAVEALKVCASKLHGLELRGKRLIATEACRAAENGEEFLQRVRAETGLELEIINRETEARLAVSGCSSLVGRETRSVVLFDIGGGSSEIAVIRIGDNRSSRLANHITHWTSLPVGVVTLSERHGGRDVSPAVFEAMIAEVAGMLDKFDCPSVEALGHSPADVDFHLIGTSGTVTTLAGVHLDLPRYDRRRVDGLWLSDDEVSAMQAKLLSWDYQSRAANPCIGPDRADLVLAGCAILEAIRRRWPSSRMRVADRGLREGLLTDMMADDGVWRRNRGRRHQAKPGPGKG